MEVKEVVAIKVNGEMIILRTLEDYRNTIKLCNLRECVTLLSLMEDVFKIPLIYSEKFWDENKEVMKIYMELVSFRNELEDYKDELEGNYDE